MELTLKIRMDNAAFEDAPHVEAARILREAALKLENGYDGAKLFDYNGNKVGSFSITD